MSMNEEAVLLDNIRLFARYPTPPGIPDLPLCRTIAIPDTPRIRTALSEVIAILCNPDVWEENPGDISAIETTAALTRMLLDMWQSNCLIGTVHPYATEVIPGNMLPCDGTEYLNTDYPLLASLIHPVYKVGADHFKTPNLSGRVVVGTGQADEVDWVVGDVTGQDQVTLTEAEMPTHTHTDTGHTHTEIPAVPSGGVLTAGIPIPSAVPGVGVTGVGFAALATTGGDLPHANVQPSLALPYGLIWR